MHLEHAPARGDGERVARQRARLVDGAGGRHLRMMSRAPAVGADGQAAADDLAEAGQVGRDAVERLRAAERDAEAGHHLVEDEHARRAGRVSARSPRGSRRAAARSPCCRHRLDDDRGDLPLVSAASKTAAHRRVEVVLRRRQRVGGAPRRTPAEPRDAERGAPEPAGTSRSRRAPW